MNESRGEQPNFQNVENSKDSPQETLEEETRIYKALRETINEEERIIKEMDTVFEITQDRSEAEKVILEKWAPLMDEVIKRISRLTIEWIEAMKKSNEEHRKER